MSVRDELKKVALELGKELHAAVHSAHGRNSAEGWYLVMLTALATEFHLSLVELIKADVERQITRVAWGTRNVMEVHYWIRFVLRSRTDARRFHEDMICDFLELAKRLAGTSAPGIEIVEASQRQIHQMLPTFETVTDKSKHLSVAKVAEEFGEAKDYGLANQILSKFVHPTSIALALRINPALYDLLAPLCYTLASNYTVKTVPLITEEFGRLSK